MAKDILYPLRRFHGWICEPQFQIRRRAIKKECLKKIRDVKKLKKPFVFLIMTPEHGNLGDHAIAFAETAWLKQLGIPYVEITGKQVQEMQRYDLLGIMNNYPILMQGGGYLGTLWYHVEETVRAIFVENPKSRIMVFPNTIYYENSAWGQEELKKSIELYSKHKHLTIYAREKTSYNIMKPIYSDVRLAPDVVLSLRPDMYQDNRHGCLLCLRGDCEKTRTEQQEKILRQQVAELFGDAVRQSDMITKPVSVDQREAALQAKFAEFSGAELVITDRLHGMIFCAITGTPCIVIDSKSPKVRGCYEWVKHLGYIRFIDDADDLMKEYGKMPKTPQKYDNSHFEKYYQELKQEIQRML